MGIQDYEDWITRVYWDYYFTILQDTPGSYEGAAGYPVVVNDSEIGLDFLSLDTQGSKYLRVKSDESGIEFVDLVLTFLGLTDTPGDFTGHAGEYTKVKSDESGLEFASPAGIPSGTRMLFKQGFAPAGWTFVSEDNDRVILNSSYQNKGGDIDGSWVVSGLSVASHTLSLAQIPNVTGRVCASALDDNSNFFTYPTGPFSTGYGGNVYYVAEYSSTNRQSRLYFNLGGGGGSHSHGISQDGTWRPAYVKVITCQKD